MAVCGTSMRFFFPQPGLFIGVNFNPLDVYGDYMGIAISKNSSICVFNCMLYYNKKVKILTLLYFFLPFYFKKLSSTVN